MQHQNEFSFSKPSDMTGETNGIVWNCGGLTNTSSSSLKGNYFQKEFGSKFDFAFLVETHHKDDAAIPNEISSYKNTHHIINQQTLQMF